MSDRIPLAEASGDEITARIAYQLIKLDYHQHPDDYEDATTCILILADHYHQIGCTLLAADIRLAGIWCAHGGTVAAWLRSRILINPGRASKLARLGRGRSR
jgi:hypothetical protein